MTANNWEQIQSLFEQALEIPSNEQASFLDEKCNGDSQLRAEVESLLESFSAAEDELEVSPVDVANPKLGNIGLHEDAIPGYKCLEEMQRGGQGVVFKAIQLSTKREVALKVLLRGPFADEASKQRFAREVELAGRLRHPGIVPVFDSGESHGHRFYAMEFISGDRLDIYAERSDLSRTEKLRLFLQICDAVGYAHQRGVIHRDIKPSNVLIDELGRARVVDFGLAKTGDSSEFGTSPTISTSGQIMGTLSYMSPEQAIGQLDSVDTRSDVYSLGVVLYELLWNELPYKLDSTLVENLSTIQNAQPQRQRGKTGDNELDTIIRKAMSKDTSRRYSNAETLGEDINRYLRGEPVEAKRDSSLYVLRKTLRRHFVVASAAAAFVALLALSTIVAWSLYLRTEEARHNEALASERYQSERNRAESLRQLSEQQLYRAEMNLAAQALRENSGIGRVEELVAKWKPTRGEGAAYQGWEWFYLNSQCDEEIESIEFGSKIWSLAIDPLQKTLALAGAPRNVVFHSLPVGPKIDTTKIDRILSSPVRSVSFNCDGTLMAIAAGIDKSYSIINVESQSRVWAFGHNDNTLAMAWHPTSMSLLATTSIDGVVKIVNVAEKAVQNRFDAKSGCHATEWSPDGRYLAIGSWGKSVTVWDNKIEKVIHRWDTNTPIYDLAWSIDGSKLAMVSARGDIEFRVAATGKVIWKRKVKQPVWRVLAHPDGNRLATMGEDRTVHIWTTKGRRIRTMRGHTGPVWGAAWLRNGTQLVTGSHDGTCRFWDFDSQSADKVFTIPNFEKRDLSEVQFSPCGNFIVVAGGTNAAFVLDATTGRIRQTLHNHKGAIESARWSPDGKRISIGEGLVASVWDVESGEIVSSFDKHKDFTSGYNLILSTSWTEDGNSIISSAHFGPIHVWNATTGELERTLEQDDVLTHSVHQNNNLLAVAAAWTHASVIDLDTGERKALQGLAGQGNSISWSPKGSELAVGTNSGQIAIHSRDGELRHILQDHVGRVQWVDWHPDGTRLASCSSDSTIRIWDTKAGSQTLVLHGHEGEIHCIDWSPDGKRLVSVGQDGRILIWDATRGYRKPVERDSSNVE